MNRKFLLTVIFLLSLFVGFSSITFATDDTMSMDMISPSVSPTISPIITIENKEINYDLPYPGLLPDSPLYVLKAIRDNIVSFFISDPAKKADYDVQQADKRMNASIYLSYEKPTNDPLISSTISKAINYFDQAVVQTKQAMQQGEDTQDFIHHMDTASQKYHQVILQLEIKASRNLITDLNADQTRLDAIQAKIKGMEKK